MASIQIIHHFFWHPVDVYAFFDEMFNDAVRSFVAELTAIHVQTGMSLATVRPLAEAVEYGPIPIIPTAPPRMGGADFPAGKYNVGVQKSIPGGEARGRDAYKLDAPSGSVFSLGSSGASVGNVYRFEWNTATYQYYMHEYGQWEQDAWMTLEHGDKALQGTLRKWLSKLPLIRDVIMSKERFGTIGGR